jgi:S-adenosylmethionine synthetase
MKVLLTGASGLLGTDIFIAFPKAGYEIIRTARSPREGFVSADISTKEGIKNLSDLSWDAIIHTAAERDPDECEKDKNTAYNLNVIAPEKLARAAVLKNAKYFFISTDYVFPGTNPPYTEESPTCAVNYYGQTKIEAERRILSICKTACILRVPILYGINAGIKTSALLYSSLKAIDSKQETFIENVIARYPTYTGDVANALLFLLKNNACGIYHFSGQDKLTKYQMVKIIAECFHKEHSHIKPLNTPPNSAAKRPLDSHLDTVKIFSLGGQKPLTFVKRVKDLLNQDRESFLK